ncbi:hypothetical protein [Roseovarius sp.]|jgi:hypothetical protein
MEPQVIFQTPIPREDLYAARSHRAKRLAGWVKLALFACVLTAIWQEKALAPPVHDQMQDVAALASSALGGSQTVQSYLSMATTTLTTMNDSETDPVSKLVLKLRQ